MAAAEVVVVDIRTITLIGLGCGWLAAALWMMVNNVILRETRLGAIATFLDRLPPAIGNPIFLLLWLAVLFGWAVPLVLGVKRLLRPKPSN